MASLVKKPNSRYFYAAFRLPETTADGRRIWKQIRKVTKHTTRREAMLAAHRLEQEAFRNAGAGEENSDRHLAILREASELAAQHRLTHDAARQMLRKMAETATGDPLKMYSARTWLTEWLAQRAATARPSTMHRYTHSVDAFIEHLGEAADRPLDYVTVSHLREFRDNLKSGGRASKTANHYLADVCSGLRAAAREGIILRNPGDNLKRLPTDDSTERGTFSMREIGKLAGSAPSADWRGVVLLGAFGGLRLSDAAHLKWDAVDLKKKFLTFVPSKTRKTLILPLHAELLTFFKKHKRTGADCFPTLAPLEVSGCNGLSARFAKVMVAAGIKRELTREKVEGMAGHRTYDRSFHSLRHTFNSLMANRGISQELRMKLTGHADTKSNDIYSHHELASLRAAVHAVPALNGKKSKGGAK